MIFILRVVYIYFPFFFLLFFLTSFTSRNSVLKFAFFRFIFLVTYWHLNYFNLWPFDSFWRFLIRLPNLFKILRLLLMRENTKYLSSSVVAVLSYFQSVLNRSCLYQLIPFGKFCFTAPAVCTFENYLLAANRKLMIEGEFFVQWVVL